MAFKYFMSSDGQEWQVYDVVPPLDERRHADRRLSEPADAAPDRRASADRRLTVGRVSQLNEEAGWLCFQSGEERRRLSPIPDDWMTRSDQELEVYCRSARVVPPTPLRGTDAVSRVKR